MKHLKSIKEEFGIFSNFFGDKKEDEGIPKSSPKINHWIREPDDVLASRINIEGISKVEIEKSFFGDNMDIVLSIEEKFVKSVLNKIFPISTLDVRLCQQSSPIEEFESPFVYYVFKPASRIPDISFLHRGSGFSNYNRLPDQEKIFNISYSSIIIAKELSSKDLEIYKKDKFSTELLTKIFRDSQSILSKFNDMVENLLESRERKRIQLEIEKEKRRIKMEEDNKEYYRLKNSFDSNVDNIKDTLTDLMDASDTYSIKKGQDCTLSCGFQIPGFRMDNVNDKVFEVMKYLNEIKNRVKDIEEKIIMNVDSSKPGYLLVIFYVILPEIRKHSTLDMLGSGRRAIPVVHRPPNRRPPRRAPYF